MRGEYSHRVLHILYCQGSPPLARGIPVWEADLLFALGITPACAGNTSCSVSPSTNAWDHPRLRGEYSVKLHNEVEITGSPPLARGILIWNQKLSSKLGITPACAGNTLTIPTFKTFPWDHPRLRGEYFSTGLRLRTSTGSPPLARGIPIFHSMPDVGSGITPACAGNTTSSWIS